MTCGRMRILCTGVLLAAGAGAVSGKDWPEWCGQPSRNMAAKSDQRLPDWADCAVDNDAGEAEPAGFAIAELAQVEGGRNSTTAGHPRPTQSLTRRFLTSLMTSTFFLHAFYGFKIPIY